MEREEVKEVLEEYGDANSEQQLIQLLKDELIKQLGRKNAETDSQKHELNLVIRQIEEELDWIENEKLAEFDPEQQ
jgi:signal recognition particle GTPase